MNNSRVSLMLLYELLRNIISMYVDIAEAANPPIKAYTIKIPCSMYMLKFNQLEITINFKILTTKGHCTKSMPFLSPVHYKKCKKINSKIHFIISLCSPSLYFAFKYKHSFLQISFFFHFCVCPFAWNILYYWKSNNILDKMHILFTSPGLHSVLLPNMFPLWKSRNIQKSHFQQEVTSSGSSEGHVKIKSYFSYFLFCIFYVFSKSMLKTLSCYFQSCYQNHVNKNSYLRFKKNIFCYYI